MTPFQKRLKELMHKLVKKVYQVTRDFPKEELFGATSQLRRAALSVILNYIEGFARFKPGTQLNFYETAYGSLKETQYLVYFAYTETWINEKTYKDIVDLIDSIGKMLWSEIQKVSKTAKS